MSAYVFYTELSFTLHDDYFNGYHCRMRPAESRSQWGLYARSQT